MERGNSEWQFFLQNMGVLLPLSFDLFTPIYVTIGSPPSFVTNCVDTAL